MLYCGLYSLFERRRRKHSIKNRPHWYWEYHSVCPLVNTLFTNLARPGWAAAVLSYMKRAVFVQPVTLLWVKDSPCVHVQACVSHALQRAVSILVTSQNITLGCLKETPHNCDCYNTSGTENARLSSFSIKPGQEVFYMQAQKHYRKFYLLAQKQEKMLDLFCRKKQTNLTLFIWALEVKSFMLDLLTYLRGKDLVYGLGDFDFEKIKHWDDVALLDADGSAAARVSLFPCPEEELLGLELPACLVLLKE